MKVSQLVPTTIGLTSVPKSVASYGVGMLLVDHADIPVDRRFRAFTVETYKATGGLTSATEQYNFCVALWGQGTNAAQAYIGRWISAATSPYFVCVGFTTVVATWAAVTDFSFTVTTTAGADILTAVNCTGDTTMADVAATIDAAIVAGGVSGGRCAVDALDRIVFTDAGVTGDGADTIVVSASGVGTDITLAAWLNIADGFAQGGMDIEAQGVALNAILAKDNTPFAICQRGGLSLR
jgi:Protein of unknown function (DUF3383).